MMASFTGMVTAMARREASGRFAVSLAVVLAVVLGYTGTAFAAPGDLDPSFDTDGKVATDFGSNLLEVATDVTVQEDGKIVVVGRADTASGGVDWGVARYNSDGTPDTTFSGDGVVMTPVGPGPDEAYDVALQGTKTVVAGSASNGTNLDFALVRYDDNGNLDSTFGVGGPDGDGKLMTDLFGGHDYGRGIVVQGDGKIVVAGQTFNPNNTAAGNDFGLVRYDANGNLDPTFGSGGKTATHFGFGSDSGLSVAVQEDGKIVAGGVASNGTNQDFAVARYRTNGSLDGEFDFDGRALVDFGGGAENGEGLALQDDGKILVAGYSSGDFAVARLNPDGSPNNSFHNDGKAKTDLFGNFDDGHAVSVQEDGRILAAGGTFTGGTSSIDFALVRYFGGDDAAPPRVRLPEQSLFTNSTLGSSVPVRISWSASDLDGEITRYELQRSADGGTYQDAALTSPTATTATQALLPKHDYRYRVRATDDSGNRSGWKYGPRFTVDALQETSTAVSYSPTGTWTQQLLSGAYGGQVKSASSAGAVARLTFTGRNVAWVAPKSSSSGQAEVLLDGKTVATVDLLASRALSRQVVYATGGLDPSTPHTLEVKVLGTANRPRVDVDAFLVLR